MWIRRLTVLGLLAGFAAMPAAAEVVQMTATLNGANEVPPVETAGTGSATVSVDTETREMRWEVTFEGLSAPISAAHFHGPSGTAQNAGVMVPIGKAGDASPLAGSAVVTPEQLADLLAGRWYINLHTPTHPPGEIRGQVVRQ